MNDEKENENKRESSLLLAINMNELNEKEKNAGRKLINRNYRRNNKKQETAQQPNKNKVENSYLEYDLSVTNKTNKQCVDNNRIQEESKINQNENYIFNVEKDCEIDERPELLYIKTTSSNESNNNDNKSEVLKEIIKKYFKNDINYL